jgi:hypothetical protein
MGRLMIMSLNDFIRKAAGWAILPLAPAIFGCGIQRGSESHPERARSTDRFVYVTADGLPDDCYRYLGTVHLSEPFANAAMDGDGSQAAVRLRKLALSKYPADVDAVIHVKQTQNETGTAVTITGQAVELTQHESVACAMRKMPGILDASAAVAAGGIVGTVAGGLLSDQPMGAMGGAAFGAAVAGANMLTDAQQQAELQQRRIKDQLAEQRREIVRLQTERARLRECQEKEIALSSCEADKAASNAQSDSTLADSAEWSASNLDLQKQIQEQQLYITRLQRQVSNMRRDMGGY